MSHNQALVLARSGQMRNAQNHVAARDRSGATDRRSRKGRHLPGRGGGMRSTFRKSGSGERARPGGTRIGKRPRCGVCRGVCTGALRRQFRIAKARRGSGTNDSRKTLRYNSSIFPRCARFSRSLDKAPLDAIECLKTALPYDLAMPGTAFFAKFGGLYPVYVRGQAYLEAGRGREAAAEFQKVLDHRGIVLADPIGALAHLQLGRALRYLGRHGQGQERLPGFPHALEGCRRGHPRPQTGQGRIREAIVVSCLRLNLCGKLRLFELTILSVECQHSEAIPVDGLSRHGTNPRAPIRRG